MPTTGELLLRVASQALEAGISYRQVSEELGVEITALRRAIPGASSQARPGRRRRADISDKDVLEALTAVDGSQRRAAEILGCSRTLIRGRMYALGLHDTNPTGAYRRRLGEDPWERSDATPSGS